MKLSKRDTKKHGEIVNLIKKRSLTDEEKDFILDNFLPNSTANPTKIGAFFTPPNIAIEFSVMCDCNDDRVLDLGAGIGSLSYGLLAGGRTPKKLVCLEQNPDFIKIGKKVLPEAEWIEGSIYDEPTIKKLGRFQWAISNPPYGLKLPKCDWLAYNGQSDLMAIEVALKAAGDAMFILPQGSVPWRCSGRAFFDQVKDLPMKLVRFMQLHPYIEFGCVSMDMAVYKDDWKDGITAVEMVHLYQRQDGDAIQSERGKAISGRA